MRLFNLDLIFFSVYNAVRQVHTQWLFFCDI